MKKYVAALISIVLLFSVSAEDFSVFAEDKNDAENTQLFEEAEKETAEEQEKISMKAFLMMNDQFL